MGYLLLAFKRKKFTRPQASFGHAYNFLVYIQHI